MTSPQSALKDGRGFVVMAVKAGSSGSHSWIDTLTSKTERQARKSGMLFWPLHLDCHRKVLCTVEEGPPASINPFQKCLHRAA